jgi:hypothetical protein
MTIMVEEIAQLCKRNIFAASAPAGGLEPSRRAKLFAGKAVARGPMSGGA